VTPQSTASPRRDTLPPPPETPKPLFIGHNSKDLLQGKQLTLSPRNDPYGSGVSNSNVSDCPPQIYDFKQSNVSTEGISRVRRNRDEYKYNLFSLIDEAGNNGCHNGCCSSN